MKRVLLVLLAFLLYSAPTPAQAVLPPDVILSVGAQASGVFSMIAVVFGLVVSGIGMWLVTFGRTLSRYSVYLAFGLLAAGLVGFQFLYFADQQALKAAYEERLATLEASIPEPGTEETLPDDSFPTGACTTCRYFGDELLLFVPGQVPVVVMLNLNRQETSSGAYTHYYYLDALLKSGPINDYQVETLPDATGASFGYVDAYAKRSAADGSVRDRYEVALTTDEQQIAVSISTTTGDFITRHTPSYTQFQSVGTTTLSLSGENSDAFYFTETTLSSDYTERIFFAGLSELVARTHQFVLWDENGDFYLIDDTEVSSDTPAYPSHTWLLYKEASTGLTKKGFRTTVSAADGGGWRVTVPDFNAGEIIVADEATFKIDGGRRGTVVRGTITDAAGERTISGIHRLVEH